MLSIIIPAYNEGDAIGETITQIQKHCANFKINEMEVIVVNDGSTDDTAEIAAKLGARVVSHPHNAGYGRSLKDGITAAKYDTIVITDADMTYPFEEVPCMLEEYNKGFDMVVGARTGEHYKESFIKSPLRKVLKFLVEFSSGRKIPDINSGLRIFSKTTVMPFFKHLCNTFSFTTSLTLAYMMTGKFVKYVDIDYHKRVGQSKVRLVKDSLRTLQYILQAVNYYNPLKLFLLFFIFSLLLSFACFFSGVIMQSQTLFQLGVGSALISLLSLCFGLIADLLKQIMDK